MDLKKINLCPQLQKRKQKFREVKVLATSTQLFCGLMRPGMQLLTPSPGHPTKQLSPSSQFLPLHIFSSPFLKEAWCQMQPRSFLAASRTAGFSWSQEPFPAGPSATCSKPCTVSHNLWRFFPFISAQNTTCHIISLGNFRVRTQRNG